MAAPPLAAQAASSERWVISGVQLDSGGSAGATLHRITGNFGSLLPPADSAGVNFRLRGGLAAHMQSIILGRPWLMGVNPAFIPMKGGGSIVCHGEELHLGAATQVRIAGLDAPVTKRTPTAVTCTPPAQDVPGWLPVILTNGGGTSILPSGVGILPMLDRDPFCPGVPFDLIYRGTRTDLVVWTLSLGLGAGIVRVPGVGYGGVLDPATFMVLTATAVSRADGIFELQIPGVTLSQRIYVQALAVSTNPGYGWSFTNAISIF